MDANRLEIQWKKPVIMKRGTRKEIENCFKKDFERVEQRAAMLAVKTERLKANKVKLKFCVVMV